MHLDQTPAEATADSITSEPTQAVDDPGPINFLVLTYEQLLTEVEKNLPAGIRNPRVPRSMLAEWLAFVGMSLEAKVGDEMGTEFEGKLALLMNQVAKSKSPKTAQNLASQLRVFHRKYMQLLHEGDLPMNFKDAIAVGLKRLKQIPQKLRENIGESAYHWARGTRTPKRKGSIDMVHKLEDYLGFPRNALVVRAHKVPSKIEDISKDLPWRRYIGAIKKAKTYRLDISKANPQLKAGIEGLIAHKKIRDFMLPDGNIVTLKPTETWNSESSVVAKMATLRSFFGFLTLPKAPVPAPTDWIEQMNYGMGLKPKDLRITMLVQKEYLFPFMQYMELRTYDKDHFARYEAAKRDEIAGSPPKAAKVERKTLSQSFVTFIVMANNLVNKPHSYLCLHPELGQELNPPVPADKWAEWCEARHKEVLVIAKAGNRKVELGKRSNKAIVSELLREDVPVDKIYQMAALMMRDMPPDTSPLWQATHWRDITIVSLMLFDPLRAKNLCWLDYGPGRHVHEDKNGNLELYIPRGEFKNNIHPHAEDRIRDIPKDLEEIIRKWVTVYRPRCPGHTETSALFLRTCLGGGKRKDTTDLRRMTENALYTRFGKHTKDYFGIDFGPHTMRTLQATTVAKHGTPSQVKAILNDSMSVAMGIYADVQNADEMKSLTKLYEKHAARGRKPK